MKTLILLVIFILALPYIFKFLKTRQVKKKELKEHIVEVSIDDQADYFVSVKKIVK